MEYCIGNWKQVSIHVIAEPLTSSLPYECPNTDLFLFLFLLVKVVEPLRDLNNIRVYPNTYKGR